MPVTKKGCGEGNYALLGHNSILRKMETLGDATFSCKDFMELDYKNCLVYCDPPYKDTTPYYRKILGDFPYEKFLDWVAAQSKKNTVIVSEYKHNVPPGALVLLEVPSKTSIRDKTGNVIETVEVLWTYNKNVAKIAS